MASDITAEKVAFAFVTMAVAGRDRFTTDELMQTALNLQAECIAALLEDETGEARETMADKLRTLWAIYEEHDPTQNPWDTRPSD